MHGHATRHRVVKAVIEVAWRWTCKQDKYLGHFDIVLPECCRVNCVPSTVIQGVKVITFSQVKLYI